MALALTVPDFALVLTPATRVTHGLYPSPTLSPGPDVVPLAPSAPIGFAVVVLTVPNTRVELT